MQLCCRATVTLQSTKFSCVAKKTSDAILIALNPKQVGNTRTLESTQLEGFPRGSPAPSLQTGQKQPPHAPRVVVNRGLLCGLSYFSCSRQAVNRGEMMWSQTSGLAIIWLRTARPQADITGHSRVPFLLPPRFTGVRCLISDMLRSGGPRGSFSFLMLQVAIFIPHARSPMVQI